MPTMQESLNKFSAGLLAIRPERESRKKDVGLSEDGIFAVLDKAIGAFEEKDKHDSAAQSNALRDTFRTVSQSFRRGIEALREEMRTRSEVRSRLEEIGDGLIVVVFGRTNAGKSTLGNFLRGKQLRNAPFPNAWKEGRIPLSPIEVIDGGTTPQGDWFAEGSTETTREAQVFQLPGLLWLDTPGFGSTNDATLGELARKWVKRADLVVYLDDSDNPGLADISRQVADVMREGRRTLIARNHSDINEIVRENGKAVLDAQGRPKRRRLAKPAKDRSDQEHYLAGVLKEKLPDQDIQAISISMLLAILAVENSDPVEAEAQYQASNVDALFSQILDNSVTELKFRDAVQNCITLIDMILQSATSGNTLDNMDAKLAHLEKSITETRFDVAQETQAVIAPILLQTHESLRRLVQHAEKSGKDKGATVDVNGLLDEAAQRAFQAVREKSGKLLKTLWLGEALDIARSVRNVASVNLSRKQEKHEYEVTETESYERSPDGIIEHFCSFFGKKYYSRRLVTRRKEQLIDLGFNVEEIIAGLSKQISEALTDYVRESLEEVRQTCLVQGAEMVRARRAILKEARDALACKKQEMEQYLTQLSQKQG